MQADGLGKIEEDEIVDRVFARVFRYGRRWDEGLWRVHEVRSIRRLLTEHPALVSLPILDLGCGDGELFEWVFGQNVEAYGVDSGATHGNEIVAARESGRYIEVREEDARALSYEKESFGLVFSNSVLEHIDRVEAVLDQVRRVSMRGGYFLFTTPDPLLYSKEVYYWRRQFARLGLERLGRIFCHRENELYHHVSVFSVGQWKNLLQASGLALIEVRPYVSVELASMLTRFSGLLSLKLVQPLAHLLSSEGRALRSHRSAIGSEWITAARRILAPFLDEQTPDRGCGHLFLARRTA